MLSLRMVVVLAVTTCAGLPVWADSPGESDPYVVFYSSKESGTFQICRLEGGKETQLTNDSQFNHWWVQVAPDHQSFLVYRSPGRDRKDHDHYPQADLMKFAIDGSGGRVLIPRGAHGWRAQGVAHWSPDGRSILMAAELKSPGSSDYQWRMVVTDSEGANPTVISDLWAIDCSWSPDGRQITYVGFNENRLALDFRKFEVHVGEYDPATRKLGSVRCLTHDESRDHDPHFSPDGKSLVYSGGNALYSNSDICILDIATGTQRKVVDDGGANGGSMCWTPDGKYIYFHSLELFKHGFRVERVATEPGPDPRPAEVVREASYPIVHPHVISRN